MKVLATGIGAIVIFVVTIGFVIFLPSYLFMLFWNFVVPSVFHGPVLSFWYAFAIVFLLQMVGGFFTRSRKT